MEFTLDNKTYTLKGLEAEPTKIITSIRMEKLLRKGHHGIVAQFSHMELLTATVIDIQHNMQHLLQKFSPIFEPPTKLPPPRPQDHMIPLIPRSSPLDSASKSHRWQTLCSWDI